MILNEEQRLLKDTVEEFLKVNAPVASLRQLRDSGPDSGFDRNLWQQLVEMGIPLTALSEESGGVGFGWLGMGAVMEACGRNLTATPLLGSVVIGATLLEMLADSQQQTLLESICAGELTLALAIDEQTHFEPGAIWAEIKNEDEQYLLSGKKNFVVDGAHADKFIVVARDSGTGALSLAIVDNNQPGVTVTPTRLMDSRSYANITFEEVSLSAQQRLGDDETAAAALEHALLCATACTAAEMLGGASELFERTVEYLKEREQFGAKIGSFQALQHRAAQMYCQLESCKSAVLNGLQSLDNRQPDVATQVSLAKTLANDCYKHISNEAVQLHGGMGVTDELDIGLFLKRARVTIQMFGDSAYHMDKYASTMGY